MVGEFTGAERGMGVLTIRAIRALDVEMTWGLATSRRRSRSSPISPSARSRAVLLEAPPVILAAPAPAGARGGCGATGLVASAGALGWAGAIWAFDLNPFFAKGPGEVFDALVLAADAGATRAHWQRR
jgi:sulfonate transport system permease protein